MASKVCVDVQKKKRSRDAARQRRGQQNDEFSELSAQLPLLPDVTSQLDRLCVMRLTNSFIKMKHISRSIMDHHQDVAVKTEDVFADIESSMIEALGGFILVITSDGQCLYVSPNVVQYLGLSQLEMVGDSVYKYIHPCDQTELAKQLGGQVPLEDMEIFDGLFSSESDIVAPMPAKKHVNDDGGPSSPYRSILLRMKSTITSRGKSVNLNASIYRAVHCIGTILPFQTKCSSSAENSSTNCFLAVGTPLLCQTTFEVPLDCQTFITKHSLDMKVLFCDERVKGIVGYTDKDIVGKSWYNVGHVCDIDVVKVCHNAIMDKGQAVSGYYRMLNKSGGWFWLQTKGSMVYSSTTCQPLYILCVNHVISGLEGECNVVSIDQSVPSIKRSAHLDTCPVPVKKSCSPVYAPPMLQCMSGAEDIAAMVSNERAYEEAVADFYDSMPLPDICDKAESDQYDEDDFDDDLPSLEFLDGDEYVPLQDCDDKFIDSEEFMLRAPFIPPPPVDEVLTNFPMYDDSFLEDVSDEDNINDAVLAARAPFIPPPCIDTLLTFDDLDDLDEIPSPSTPGGPPLYTLPTNNEKNRQDMCNAARPCTTPPSRLVDIGPAAVPVNLIVPPNRKRKADDCRETKMPDKSTMKTECIDSGGGYPPGSAATKLLSKWKQTLTRDSMKALLPLITNMDAEMNCPSYDLLQGGDLFFALEQLDCPTLR